MKKLFLLGVAAAMGFGCALTNYQLITDNDVGGIVNTNGKAYIKQSFQVAIPQLDGYDNVMYFVDQKANGDRTLTNYEFHTPGPYPGVDPFKDDIYCSPDWNGCSMLNGYDPEVGDVSPFDYTYNKNCPGLRSLQYVLSLTEYYYPRGQFGIGECGRANTDRLSSMLNIANQMSTVQVNGHTWLKQVLNSTNMTWVMNNHNGSTQAFSPAGDIPVLVNPIAHRAVVDLQNPVLRQTFQQIRSWSLSHPGPYLSVTRVINGESFTTQQKMLSDNLSNFIDLHY